MSVPKIVVSKPTAEQLTALGVKSWPIWEKETSIFEWSYEEKEVCYFLEGQVRVSTPYETVSFGKGDMVIFPKDLDCTWQVIKPVRKHYKFGD